MSKAPEYLSPKELAARYGISVSAVNSLIRSGRLPVLEFGPRLRRVDVREAERLLRADVAPART
uniref:helix-turn-helix domain-containing protein n=1 Tax=uncultured Micrococcus sp. TaxID=114051 RepID=UPI00262EFF77|nr:helix-turn-helix domain-containing protein [uncultured Micrococcus sp.]